ncbi:sigma-70 family RNA polymerase sigma factor [Pectinatus haikarae]|uniref:RNA polymerase sigma factor n=1 Tax=Pectinatus haikarae TaxID=349096 RepID=A0ABT9Y7E6_9FIRM|nr:FliA/WhiG family RNA polymerase sigma factor [Pectinatus haikarae]MDQ0203752.1 RNA polymerase sigma factor for flagellar operon FliA [Pectinatus haikarae]
MQIAKSFSATDIADLWKKYKENNDMAARNNLIENYLALVNIVVGHISYNLPSHIERDDLISSGFFGLMDAIARFDINLGIKFETYARSRIRGSVLDYLRSKDWLSVSLRKKIKTYETVYTKLEAKLERVPTKNELAESLSVSLDELYSLESNMSTASLVSLEDYISAEYAVSQGSDLDKRLNREFIKQKLTEAINKLAPKEKLIISLYYSEELTLKEIGLTLNLSEARISQLHKRAVLRLRGYLARSKSDFF